MILFNGVVWRRLSFTTLPLRVSLSSSHEHTKVLINFIKFPSMGVVWVVGLTLIIKYYHHPSCLVWLYLHCYEAGGSGDTGSASRICAERGVGRTQVAQWVLLPLMPLPAGRMGWCWFVQDSRFMSHSLCCSVCCSDCASFRGLFI